MKDNPARKKPLRGRENATMTISLPRELKEAIAQLAAKDQRTVSNFIAVEMAALLRNKSAVTDPATVR